MGVKDFSKAFASDGTITLKDLKSQKLGIDAMTELYRSALGMKSVKALTDKNNNSTVHINSLLAKILEFQRNRIEQVWIFDHDQHSSENAEFHNPAKLAELAKRHKRKEEARRKLKLLNDTDELFSDTDDDTDDESKSTPQKHSLEKQLFTVTPDMINDLKLMLNCFNIRYIESPKGFEGEQVASAMCQQGLLDGVYSSDTDPIPFGTTNLYRLNPRDKKIYHYSQQNILSQIMDKANLPHVPTLDDIRKICVILGTDFAEKTSGVGPKTVLKKYQDITLSPEQQKAVLQFSTPLDVHKIHINNFDKPPFTSCAVHDLITWLTDERSFNSANITARISKVIDLTTNTPITKEPNPKKPTTKPRTPKKPTTKPRTPKKPTTKPRIPKKRISDSDSDSDNS